MSFKPDPAQLLDARLAKSTLFQDEAHLKIVPSTSNPGPLGFFSFGFCTLLFMASRGRAFGWVALWGSMRGNTWGQLNPVPRDCMRRKSARNWWQMEGRPKCGANTYRDHVITSVHEGGK